jgi:hypothetical protein
MAHGHVEGVAVRGLRIFIALAGASTAQVHGASLTLGTLLDSDDAVSWQAVGTVAPARNWLLGAGAGTHDLQFDGERYTGTSLQLATRVNMRSFFAGVSGQHWKDSGDLRSVVLQGELGWMSQSGLTLSLLGSDRSLRAPFTTLNLLGQPLAHEAKSDGQGLGAGIAWTGRGWNLSARFLDYHYRHRHEGEIAPVISVPALLDELESIGDDLSGISAATPVLQILQGAGLLGTVQDVLDTAGGVAGSVVPAVVELTDGVASQLPLPLPTVSDLLNLGLFPRLQQLVASPLSLVAGAPDRELTVTVGRQFLRASLRADWLLQRDALTRDEVSVTSMTFGYRFSERFGIDATAGVASGGVGGRVSYGGLSLTLRSAP